MTSEHTDKYSSTASYAIRLYGADKDLDLGAGSMHVSIHEDSPQFFRIMQPLFTKPGLWYGAEP